MRQVKLLSVQASINEKGKGLCFRKRVDLVGYLLEEVRLKVLIETRLWKSTLLCCLLDDPVELVSFFEVAQRTVWVICELRAKSNRVICLEDRVQKSKFQSFRHAIKRLERLLE